MESILLGEKYSHYKGNDYRILQIATHSETHERLVIYQDCNSPEKIWARPESMFFEKVEFEGKMVDRFKKLQLSQV